MLLKSLLRRWLYKKGYVFDDLEAFFWKSSISLFLSNVLLQSKWARKIYLFINKKRGKNGKLNWGLYLSHTLEYTKILKNRYDYFPLEIYRIENGYHWISAGIGYKKGRNLSKEIDITNERASNSRLRISYCCYLWDD